MIGNRFLELARNVSKHSCNKHKVGAVIVRKGTPIAVGFNKIKMPNKRFITRFNTTHAEISAIMSSGKEKIKKSTIYVYREDRYGNPKLSKPCKFCQEELKKFGVKIMVFSTSEYPFWSAEEL